MANISKISPDDGSTILNIKDSNAVHWVDNAILGAKNLLKNTATTQTISDVLFTRNSDGSVTENGTASAYIEYPILNWSEHNIPLGQYILTGCPTGGANDKYRLLVQFSNSISGTNPTNYIDYGDGISVNDVSKSYMRILINISSGQVVNNLTFKPMLRLASDTDDTYVQYAMTNRELTEVQKITFLNDTTNSRFIKGYKVGRIVNICIKGSFPQNDTYPTLDTPIPDSWYPYESIAVSNYSAGQNTGTAFAMIDVDSKKIRISNVANVSYYNTTLSYISKG